MHKPNQILSLVFCAVAAPASMIAAQGTAQTRPAVASQPAVAAAPLSEQDFATEQEKLIQLLKTSPTLTTVVAHGIDQSKLFDLYPKIGEGAEKRQFN